MKVYLAGKITGTSWRRELVEERLNAFDDVYGHDGLSTTWSFSRGRLRDCVRGGHDYVGPFYMADHHQGNAPGTHRNGIGDLEAGCVCSTHDEISCCTRMCARANSKRASPC